MSDESNGPVVKNVDCGELDGLNFGMTSLPIGVMLPGNDQPWLGLSRDDLTTLKMMLETGCDVDEDRPVDGALDVRAPVDRSARLMQLCMWIDGALRWMDRGGFSAKKLEA